MSDPYTSKLKVLGGEQQRSGYFNQGDLINIEPQNDMQNLRVEVVGRGLKIKTGNLGAATAVTAN
jgi:hypothetical protein